jgi:nucleoside-diphosphate-sugar epimerase
MVCRSADCCGWVWKASAVARLTDSLLVGSAEIRAELGWQPQTSLAAAMRLTGEWFWRQP